MLDLKSKIQNGDSVNGRSNRSVLTDRFYRVVLEMVNSFLKIRISVFFVEIEGRQ